MIRAVISQSRREALFERRGKFYLIDSEVGAPHEVSQRQVRSFLIGSKDCETLFVVDLHAVRSHLAIRCERERILGSVLIFLDKKSSPKLKQAAQEIIVEASTSDQWGWVEGVLLSTEAPEDLDLDPSIEDGHPLREIVGRLRGAQPAIFIASQLWASIPDSEFGALLKDGARSQAVRSGVFPLLVLGRRAWNVGPFASAIDYYQELSLLLRPADLSRESKSSSHALVIGKNRTLSSVKNYFSSAPLWVSWLGASWPTTQARMAFEAAEGISAFVARSTSVKTERVFLLKWTWEYLIGAKEFARSLEHLSQLAGRNAAQRKISDNAPSHFSAAIKKAMIEVAQWVARHKSPKNYNTIYSVFFPQSKGAGTIDIADSAELLGFDSKTLCGYAVNEWASTRSPKKTLTSREQKDIRTILKIYCLDNIFCGGGFVVIRDADLDGESKGVYLDNFTGENFEQVEDDCALIADLLSSRLANDLASGLPLENCGWIDEPSLVRALTKKQHELSSAVVSLKRVIEDRKFSLRSLQERDCCFRFSPEFVVVTRSHRS